MAPEPSVGRCTDPLRILVVIPSYLPAVRFGGPVFVVHGLCRSLVDAGHRVEVLTTDADVDGRLDVPLDRPVLRDGVSVRYCRFSAGPGGLGRRLYHAPALAAMAAEHMSKADVVHLHSVFLWPTLCAARVAAAGGKPYVVTPHGMLDEVLIKAQGTLRKRLWIALFERRTLARAATVHVTSELEARQVASLGFERAPVRCVPNGLDFDITDSPEPDAEGRESGAILSLGRLNWKKGCEVLLDALALVPCATLTFAGDGEPDYVAGLKRQAARLGLESRVRFVGQVGPDARRALLDASQCLVLPSTSENFALVVAEAMARACPVVVSPAVGLADAVDQARAGVVANATPEDTARAVQHILDDPRTAAMMGRRGRAHALQHFSWARVAPQMEALYRDVLRNARDGTRGAPAC